MSAINLAILNGGDKTHHYSVVVGTGAPSTTSESLVADVNKYPIGSFYLDKTSGALYARKASAKEVADWVDQTGPTGPAGADGAAGADGLFTAPLANCVDYPALKTAMIAAGLMAAE